MEQRSPVTVAALTYRRPVELDRLLPLLVEQAADLTPRAQVLIVDNDPDGGAADQVAAWAHAGVIYVHEPRPGIVAGRNRAIDEATTRGSAAVVFIDDDEAPGPQWLALLVAAWHRFGSAVVTGPVRSEFEHPPDEWVVGTRVFERASRPTGASRAGAASNNLLLDVEWLRSKGLRFDPEFGESGGSDTMLTHQIVAAGGEIRWCDEAEVVEAVPAGRLTHRWVARRIRRTSNSWARTELKIGAQQGHGFRRRLEIATRVPYFLGRGLATVGVGVVRRQPAVRGRGAGELCQAAGVGQAVVGFVNMGYRRR
jgi:glycosyltransferase involved in cell wall biosynthesis